jgi:IclR family transcriptional regulator, KDG regulon repressor
MPNDVRIFEHTQSVKLVNSVDRAVRILDLLAEEGSLSLAGLAEKLGAPKTTVLDIVRTLEARGMVHRDADSGSYSLGLHTIELGYAAVSTFGIRRIVAPVLQALNARLDETVHLTVLDEDQVLYVDCYESTKRLRTYSVIGIRGPLHCTSVGKAILAWLPDERRERLIETIEYTPFTANTITGPAGLRDELAETRRRGYSIDDVEHEEGVRCVGAPVFDHRGDVVASISVSGPTQRVREEIVPDLARTLTDAAAEMSRRLGFKSRESSPSGEIFSKES